jgi:hypothetical protein
MLAMTGWKAGIPGLWGLGVGEGGVLILKFLSPAYRFPENRSATPKNNATNTFFIILMFLAAKVFNLLHSSKKIIQNLQI